MPSTDTQNSLNALETRDITLPRRLWSWLATQAKKSGRSVDEVIADLIDTHRHPEVAPPESGDESQSDREATEQRTAGTTQADAQDAAPTPSASRNNTDPSRPQGAPPPSANAPQSTEADNAKEGGPDTYSAADRLRKASDRLQHLMNEEESETGEQTRKARSSESTSTQIQDLLKNNDKLQTLEPPEPTSKKDPDEGVSMFDMAAGADDEKDDTP
ncbi:hypothetical protein [Longimonas halophila]|nr:hypothetical protein [Longimonas halophila]